MAKYIFDYEKSKNKAIVVSENLENLRNAFSIEDTSARFRPGKQRFFTARKSIITPTGRYNDGLTLEFIKYLKTSDETNEVIVTPELKSRLKHSFDIEIAKMNLELRPYQEEALQKMLKWGRGLCIVGTGGGKTLITSTLIQSLLNYNSKFKILLILPPQLVNQTYKEFILHGINPDIISTWNGDNPVNRDSNIIICNFNILQSKKQDTSWVKNVDVLMFDEVHRSKKSNSITKIVEKVKTPHKFGFTGTLPVDNLDKWNVMGIFGSTLIEIKGAELREMKFISTAKVTIIEVDYPENFKTNIDKDNPVKGYHEELEFIMANEKRNMLIASISKKVKNNMLILVDRIEHGNIIKEFIENKCENKQVFFICGETPQEERDEIQKLMESCSDVICIAMNSIFSTGINIKNLHYIMFGSGGKAAIRIIQSIGRGLRLHPDKKYLVLFDLADKLHYGIKHLNERIKIYEEEKLSYDRTTI